MKRKYILLIVAVLFITAGCTKTETQLDLQSPFISGTTGVVIDFQNLRKTVMDGGRDPFDILVRLENKGESDVVKNKINVKLSGFNPLAFSKLEEQLVKSPDEDLLGIVKDPQGNIRASPPTTVEFTNLNHFSLIPGASADFVVRAEVCYLYKTTGVSKVCVRSNLVSFEAGGLCEVNEDKPVYSSGAPVQLRGFKEYALSKDKLGFSFELAHAGQGRVFERDNGCDETQRKNVNKMYVKIDTKLNGLTCEGLSSQGSTAEGFVTLFDGVKIVSCKQPVSTKTNFEQQVTIEGWYDYDDFKQETITVKSSGETQSVTSTNSS